MTDPRSPTFKRESKPTQVLLAGAHTSPSGRHTFLRRGQDDAGQQGANVGEKWAHRVVWHLQRLSQPGVASLPQWEGALASGHTGLGHGRHSLWHSQTNIFPCLNLSFLVFKSTFSQNDLLTPGQDALSRQMPACPCAGPSLGTSVLIIGPASCRHQSPKPGRLREPIRMLMLTYKWPTLYHLGGTLLSVMYL